MPDIFNRSGNQLGGTIAADAAKIVFSSGGTPGLAGGVGLLSQTAQIGYQQNISRIYEIGSNFTFLVAGRTQGQMALGRVLGPRRVMPQFYRNYGDVCNAANNNVTISMEAGCVTTSGTSTQVGALAFLIKNVVIVSFGINVQAQDQVVNEQLATMFISLELQA